MNQSTESTGGAILLKFCGRKNTIHRDANQSPLLNKTDGIKEGWHAVNIIYDLAIGVKSKCCFLKQVIVVRANS